MDNIAMLMNYLKHDDTAAILFIGKQEDGKVFVSSFAPGIGLWVDSLRVMLLVGFVWWLPQHFVTGSTGSGWCSVAQAKHAPGLRLPLMFLL